MRARIFLPDYHKLAARQGRVIAPRTAKVRLSTKSGYSTITWTPQGEDIPIDWDTLESVENAPDDLPGGVWTAQFPALASGAYYQGTLMIELLDSADQVITRGYNEETLEILPNETAGATFFTIPVAFDSDTGELEGDEMRFWRIYRMAYPYKLTLTAGGSWPDIVLFNADGTFHSYYSIGGAEDSEIMLPTEGSSAYYYIGVWADDGKVDSYNLDFEFNGDPGDVAAIKDDFSGGLGAWTVKASGYGATPPAIVADGETGKQVVEFNARSMYLGDRASISRIVEAPVPMGLSFMIKTNIGADVNTAMVLYIDDTKIASWNGLGGSWTQASFVVEAGVHELRWALEKDSNYFYTATDSVRIGDVSLVPDLTDSVVLYPRADQETYVGGFPIQYTAQALRSDGSVRSNAAGFVYSGSGSGGSVASDGLFSPGSAAGTYRVSVTLDGKTVSAGTITVHPADYLRQPYTYPGTGLTYNGYNGTEVSGSITGGITVTYPAVRGTSFSADGFFTLEGRVDNPDVYDYALIYVAKGDLATYYIVRGSFKTRIWLRFGPGEYTVYIVGFKSITADLNGEGDLLDWDNNTDFVYYTVANTHDDGAGHGVADRRFLYPSCVVQSDDFRVTNLARELTYNLTDPVDRIRAIHDYLVKNTVYDYDSLIDGERKKQDALTVLGKRYHIDSQYDPAGHYLAVCEGYANASAALLRAAGFETKYQSSSAMTHGWNHVYVEGAWKFYDVTWDKPAGISGQDMGPDSISYTYFLLTSLTGVGGDHYGDTTDNGRSVLPSAKPPRQRGVPDGWY
jgi:transglutaminase-like putative cysteine protease